MSRLSEKGNRKISFSEFSEALTPLSNLEGFYNQNKRQRSLDRTQIDHNSFY